MTKKPRSFPKLMILARLSSLSYTQRHSVSTLSKQTREKINLTVYLFNWPLISYNVRNVNNGNSNLNLNGVVLFIMYRHSVNLQILHRTNTDSIIEIHDRQTITFERKNLRTGIIPEPEIIRSQNLFLKPYFQAKNSVPR